MECKGNGITTSWEEYTRSFEGKRDYLSWTLKTHRIIHVKIEWKFQYKDYFEIMEMGGKQSGP